LEQALLNRHGSKTYALEDFYGQIHLQKTRTPLREGTNHNKNIRTYFSDESRRVWGVTRKTPYMCEPVQKTQKDRKLRKKTPKLKLSFHQRDFS